MAEFLSSTQISSSQGSSSIVFACGITVDDGEKNSDDIENSSVTLGKDRSTKENMSIFTMASK